MPNYGHLSLSCAKIERPSPLEKPSCKVRFYAQNRFRKYRQKVTVTGSISNRFSSRFSTSLTNGPRSLSRVKAGTHSAFGERSHTAAYTPKQGPSLPQPQRGFALPVKSLCYTARFHRAFIYIHFPVLCEPSLSATALSQTIFHPNFQLLSQTAHIRFCG